MIKYVELTAPEASAYRQAKILSFECKEGDSVKAGDTLFIVQSGNSKLELPSTKDGRIVEFIVTEQENITLSTPLLLLETEINSRTASAPITEQTPPSKQQAPVLKGTVESGSEPKKTTKAKPKTSANDAVVDVKVKPAEASRLEQQSLDLLAGLKDPKSSTNKSKNSDHRNANIVPSQPTATLEKTAMSEILTITVPDIGADSAKVIEILVSVGDTISAEDAIVTLESDKASMDVPSPHAGTVKSISVSVDDDVSEGALLIEVEASTSGAVSAKASAPAPESDSVSSREKIAEAPQSVPPTPASETLEITIPDIGGDSAKVVDVLVSVGDEVNVEDPLVTLESDKASMDVPSSAAGTIQSIEVSIDDDVSEGTVVAVLIASNATSIKESQAPAAKVEAPESKAERSDQVSAPEVQPEKPSAPISSDAKSYASPSIRRFARELGVDLNAVNGSGRKNRITKDDVKSFVKGVMSKPSTASAAASTGAGIPAVPAQDFSKFGEIAVQPLNKIKRLTATNLHRSWLNVPHVTHNDEANINDLEAFRKQLNAEYQKQKKDIKLSPLAFIVKAVVSALQTYPQFNSSLEPGGENLIFKKYYHVGIAVDTPNGLVVPVIRDADTKSVAEIATEMGDLAKKARDKKLTMNDMSGACFTISSLGGIGGTSFTPIVNAPEVAILGVSRSKVQPVWNGSEFEPGMMLPLSLSYDHRVIDGAEAARFARHIASILEDIRRLAV